MKNQEIVSKKTKLQKFWKFVLLVNFISNAIVLLTLVSFIFIPAAFNNNSNYMQSVGEELRITKDYIRETFIMNTGLDEEWYDVRNAYYKDASKDTIPK